MKKRWLIAVIVIYIVVRAYIATLSSYGFYHGWNEGYYSLIAKNYFSVHYGCIMEVFEAAMN